MRAGTRNMNEMRQKPRSLFLVLVIAFAAIIISPRFLLGDNETAAGKGITVEKKTSKDGHHYTIFYKKMCSISFETERPSKDDKSIQLCIAGAFTDLETYSIDGACVCKGKRCNEKVNHTLGGAFKIDKDQYTIFPTDKGKLLTDSLLDTLAARGGSLFQQIQIVTGGKAATFKDQKVFQRRCLVQMKDKSWAVAESQEAITLADFTNDITEFGAYNALYTDMGSWDEGWYRDPGTEKRETIGQIRTETSKQSNWIIFVSK